MNHVATNPMIGQSEAMPLHLTRLGPVVPLDTQLGVHPALTHPAVLSPWLFADDGCETYAILDAARIRNFGGPESLFPTPCVSLFSGTAAEDLSDAAPYLLHLTPHDTTLQRLMTRTPLARDLWDAKAVIYVRTATPLDVLRRHLRRFTRVRDAAGAWFFFRFWDPRQIVPLLLAMQHHPADLAGFLAPIDGDPIRHIIAPTPEDTLVISANIAPPAVRQAFFLRDGYRAVFEAELTEQFYDSLAQRLLAAAPRQSSAFGVQIPAPLVAAIRQIARDLRPFGVHRKADIARLSVCTQFYGSFFLHDPRFQGPLQKIMLRPRAPSVNVLHAEERLKAGPLHAKVTTPAGLVQTLQALQSLDQAEPALGQWLGQILSPDWGFATAEDRDTFVAVAHQQQWAGTPVSDSQVRVHYVMARLYGPFWHADPIQPGLAALWQARGADLLAQVMAECARRISVLKGAGNG